MKHLCSMVLLSKWGLCGTEWCQMVYWLFAVLSSFYFQNTVTHPIGTLCTDPCLCHFCDFYVGWVYAWFKVRPNPHDSCFFLHDFAVIYHEMMCHHQNNNISKATCQQTNAPSPYHKSNSLGPSPKHQSCASALRRQDQCPSSCVSALPHGSSLEFHVGNLHAKKDDQNSGDGAIQLVIYK